MDRLGNTSKHAGRPAQTNPKRYTIDRSGKRTLIGLSFEETREFERAADMHATGMDEYQQRDRWFALYTKHERGWKRRLSKVEA